MWFLIMSMLEDVSGGTWGKGWVQLSALDAPTGVVPVSSPHNTTDMLLGRM